MSRLGKADKRKLSSDEDEDMDLQDQDEDLEMDEEERERFNQMSEKEREIEIFRRLEQREIMKTREQIKRKLEMAAGKGKQKDSSKKTKKRKITEDSDEDELSGVGAGNTSDEEEGETRDDTSEDEEEKGPTKKKQSSAVKTEMEAEEDGALNTEYHKPSELANKQNKKKAMADLLNKRKDRKKAEEKRKKEASKAALDLDEIFGNDDDEDGKSLSSSSSSASSSRSSSPSKSRSPSPVAQPIQTRQDLIKGQVIRRRLARIVNAPFFTKTVVGCFVRVQIGSNDGKATYRIAQVVDVVETAKIYEVEPGSDVRTNKGFKLKICNNDTQRVIRLEFVSNGEFSDNEYAFWLKRMQETGTPLPTVDFMAKKQKELQDALNYKYTDEEINQMVKEKQRFKRNPTNFAFQKAELLKQKEDAGQNGDKDRVRDLQQQINDLEEKAKKIECQRTKALSAVSAINQRNRDHMKQYFLNTEKMVANEHNKVVEDDPFTRKSARMKLVTGTSKSKSPVPPAAGTTMSSSNMPALVASPLSMLGSAVTSCATNLPSFGNDLFSAHGIEINIDLNKVLSASQSSSFRTAPVHLGSHMMASRPAQKSSSSRTLTLEEYKKKYSQRLAPTAAGPSA